MINFDFRLWFGNFLRTVVDSFLFGQINKTKINNVYYLSLSLLLISSLSLMVTLMGHAWKIEITRKNCCEKATKVR